MNDDTIADLKQFIAGLLAQQTSELRVEFHAEIAQTNKKIDNLSAAVAEALDNANEITEKHLKNHERRIVRPERKVV